jgi:hypothetical protein
MIWIELASRGRVGNDNMFDFNSLAFRWNADWEVGLCVQSSMPWKHVLSS